MFKQKSDIMDNVVKKKASILIIEDNELDMLVLKVLLEKYFNLYMVTNGYDAIKAAKELDFDIVLADINLGDSMMDGIKVMTEIRKIEKNSSLKIFAVTAYAEHTDLFGASGFDQVLSKPVIKEEIFEILNGSYDASKFSVSENAKENLPG